MRWGGITIGFYVTMFDDWEKNERKKCLAHNMVFAFPGIFFSLKPNIHHRIHVASHRIAARRIASHYITSHCLSIQVRVPDIIIFFFFQVHPLLPFGYLVAATRAAERIVIYNLSFLPCSILPRDLYALVMSASVRFCASTHRRTVGKHAAQRSRCHVGQRVLAGLLYWLVSEVRAVPHVYHHRHINCAPT